MQPPWLSPGTQLLSWRPAESRLVPLGADEPPLVSVFLYTAAPSTGGGRSPTTVYTSSGPILSRRANTSAPASLRRFGSGCGGFIVRSQQCVTTVHRLWLSFSLAAPRIMRHLRWIPLAALLALPWQSWFAATHGSGWRSTLPLDRGASYDYNRGQADFGASHRYIPLVRRHATLVTASGWSLLGTVLYVTARHHRRPNAA